MAPRKATKKKTTKEMVKSTAANNKALWDAYKALQKRVDTAWNQLRLNVKKKAPASTIAKDRNTLMLLLGECNYMARECEKAQKRSKQKKA
jgi:hypothetical protein